MLRQQINEALKESMLAKETVATATLRLILAALKVRDIAARGKGESEGIADSEVLEVLQQMVRQRHESIEMYKKGERPDLVTREEAEIEVIRRFLPEPMNEEAVRAAAEQIIAELGASSLKDMGPVMGALKTRYAGRMDFRMASSLVKEALI